jgi:hypothetical protein
MKKAIEERLVAVERALAAETQARRQKLASEGFWHFMAEISSLTGIHPIGTAFRRRYPGMSTPADRPPPRTVEERGRRVIEAAERIVREGEARQPDRETPLPDSASDGSRRTTPAPGPAGVVAREQPGGVTFRRPPRWTSAPTATVRPFMGVVG